MMGELKELFNETVLLKGDHPPPPPPPNESSSVKSVLVDAFISTNVARLCKFDFLKSKLFRYLCIWLNPEPRDKGHIKIFRKIM